MGERRKIYVTSGTLCFVAHATSPLDAIKNALDRTGDHTLGHHFLLDERGFRTEDNAHYAVPVEQALAEVGDIFEDDDESAEE